ncbi:MAG: AMP-binding protein [Bacteroidetes bacterium]|nr:AMP-binding protein [Bacteroidota bacterium]
MNQTFPFDQHFVWHPDQETIKSSNLQSFMDTHHIASYEALMERSTSDIAWFWGAVMDQMDIQFEKPYTQIVDLSKGPEFPAWCPGARMNIVHNLLDKWLVDPKTASRTALKYESEEGHVLYWSYEELSQDVCRLSNALRSAGFGKGDAIGLFMPMTPELIAAFLAIIKIGGVVLPLFSGYGASAITTRLVDANAVALFTSDGAPRRGRVSNKKEVADQALEDCPDIRKVIVVNRCGSTNVPMKANRDIDFLDFIEGHAAESVTESTSAEDVMMIIYTSGTTGKPKGAIHTHCGFPIKGAQDMFHAMDVKPGESMYWMSDMGWMMGPWLVFGTLVIGASMVIYDGAPDFPEVDRIWQLVDRHQVTHLGLSPVLIRTLMPKGKDWVERNDLSSLRTIGSTGSPWDPSSWSWVFDVVLKRQHPILNYSGGTEISGGIVCGNFFKPLKPCSFTGPVPGMAADVVDEGGNSVLEEVGELVIRQPWIGMTRGFWNDDAARYLESYWNRFKGVWVHGDFAAIDKDGSWFILGRSDDTIKIAGKRLGPSEIEAIINSDTEVGESAAIGIPHDIKGEEVGLYVVLVEGIEPTEEIRQRLIQSVMNELGKPLKPGFIKFARALPKTRNAKVMRRVIQATYLGKDLGDITSLEDPSSILAIQQAN